MKNEEIFTVDKTTKIILAVIAVMLIAIVGKLYLTPEKAIANPSVMDVNIKYIDGRNPSNSEISINLEKIDGRSLSGALPVSLNYINNGSIPSGVIPVDIKMVAGFSQYNGVISVKVIK